MTDALNDWVSVEAAVVAARLGGMSLAALCSTFGLGECQTKNVLRRHGLPTMSPKHLRQIPPEAVEQMRALRAAGLSQRRIAEITGWSRGGVCRALDRRGKE